MDSKSYADRVAGATFLIGLGLLFTPFGGIVGGFFPGILFVIGASALVKGLTAGEDWNVTSGGLWMIGLGLVFLIGFSLPLLLILGGVALLFGYSCNSNHAGKYKNDFATEKPKNDQYV